jgi:uncharacterized membrane protein
MNRVLFAAIGILLSGCVSQVSLISQDSQRYVMAVDQMAKRLSVNIDGVAFVGTAVGSDSVGIATTQSFGLRPTTSMSTIVVPGATGQALLTSANGDYLECSYAKDGRTIIGKCQTNKGRQFVMTTM